MWVCHRLQTNHRHISAHSHHDVCVVDGMALCVSCMEGDHIPAVIPSTPSVIRIQPDVYHVATPHSEWDEIRAAEHKIYNRYREA